MRKVAVLAHARTEPLHGGELAGKKATAKANLSLW
jgi:hypothetical protein